MLTLANFCVSNAQERRVEGFVKDLWGTPQNAVTVTSGMGKNGTSTDRAGHFSLLIDDGSTTLIIRKRNYLQQEINCSSQAPLNIILVADAHRMDEIVDLGYTQMLRQGLGGAVTTVYGSELERAPVANLTQTFAGHFPGMITQETSSELSRATTNTYIRGLSAARLNGPLVMIDGIMNSYNSAQSLEYISPNEIEEVSLLKDASTQAMYGIQGANGVLVITTKRGQKGLLRIHATLDESLQQPTTKPLFINALQYAELRNQAAENDGIALPFSDETLAHFRTGDKPDFYPNHHWYNEFVKPLSSMQRVGLNASGGNDRVLYYSNLNFMRQGGIFYTDQKKYNPDPYSLWVNYRSNVDMTITNYLKAFVRLSGNIKREHTPGNSVAAIYQSIFMVPPIMAGPLTPEVINELTGEPAAGSQQVVVTEKANPTTYGMLNRSGYINHMVTNITSQFGLNADLSFLTPGLAIEGIFAYQTNSVGSLSTKQDYERWIRDPSASLDELTFIKQGSNINEPLSYSKSNSNYYHIDYQTKITYNHSFGLHEVGSVLYGFYQDLSTASTTLPDLFPFKRVSTGMQTSYGYDKRYFLQTAFGYSGSDQYARNHRYTFTPAFAVAWLASNENFLKRQSVLTNLRFRASWGKTGNDQSGEPRYSYQDQVTAAGGGPIAYLQYLVTENQFGNPNIQAEISTKTNLGIDIGLWRSLTMTVDIFKEKMSNMIVPAVSTIPLYQGIPLGNYPDVNEGIYENKGGELTLNYSKEINKNLHVNVGGMLTYVQNKVLKINEGTLTDDYIYRKRQEGYSYGQAFTYLVDYSHGNGYFNTQEEIDANQVVYPGTVNAEGKPRLGDLRLQDLNHDGVINSQDQAPVGKGRIPRMVYGFHGGFRYKNFNLNILFQGLADYSSLIQGAGVTESTNDGIFGSWHLHAWTPQRYANGEKISYPALTLTKSASQQASDFFYFDRSYLRLKNVELSYTIGTKAAKAIGAAKVRIILSGQNLLTWDTMKTTDFGPEGGGYLDIPVYRVYNLGLSLDF